MESLRELLTGRILLLCHHNADPDAVCSAFGVQRLIGSIDPSSSVEIFLPGGASAITRRIMEALGIQVLEDASIDEVLSRVCFLDSRERMNAFRAFMPGRHHDGGEGVS